MAFHTVNSGLELAVAVALQVLPMTQRVHFKFPVREDATELFSNGCGEEEPRLPRNLRIRSRGRASAGGGINAMVTRRGVRVPVLERFRRRGEGGPSVDAGAENHQPPCPSAGGGQGG